MTKPHINRPANQRQHVEEGVGVGGDDGPRSSAAGLLPSSLMIVIIEVLFHDRERVKPRRRDPSMCWVLDEGARCDTKRESPVQTRKVSLLNDTSASAT